MWIITSIPHLSKKFSTPNGIGCVRACQKDSKKCYGKTVMKFQKRRDKEVDILDRQEEVDGESVEMEDMEVGHNVFTMEGCFDDNPVGDMNLQDQAKKLTTELEESIHILPGETPGAPSSVQGDFDFDLDPRMSVSIVELAQRKIRMIFWYRKKTRVKF